MTAPVVATTTPAKAAHDPVLPNQTTPMIRDTHGVVPSSRLGIEIPDQGDGLQRGQGV